MTHARERLIGLLLLLAAAGCQASKQGTVIEQKAGASAPVVLAMENAPTPPVTGSNTITVVVKDSDGTPVTDATVTGELFMPVMESMGRTAVAFRPDGNGRYTGQGTLSMAGAWQIAVTAKRAGQTVGTRTFNLTTRS